MIASIHRVEIDREEYTLLKCDWLTKLTDDLITAYRQVRRFILGPGDLTKTVYSSTPPTRYSSIQQSSSKQSHTSLANRVEHQVGIVPHPCMEIAVTLDPTVDFFKCLKPAIDFDDDDSDGNDADT
ncbi:hypothetical protein CYMTET_20589 [Cymbomonas tetramitiformis]|uniref:Uncharacterized protein n=1 Tax=Cymbomonas tetramitiformis TaxID=36881 RepID=A0AAE0L441_9CHLO|nr:hypothetical protein CYMTET_20589 [Cymbomonas tetramitiformis]